MLQNGPRMRRKFEIIERPFPYKFDLDQRLAEAADLKQRLGWGPNGFHNEGNVIQLKHPFDRDYHEWEVLRGSPTRAVRKSTSKNDFQ